MESLLYDITKQVEEPGFSVIIEDRLRLRVGASIMSHNVV
jgi:hypothetical protein